jgi:hypothetical protein
MAEEARRWKCHSPSLISDANKTNSRYCASIRMLVVGSLPIVVAEATNCWLGLQASKFVGHCPSAPNEAHSPESLDRQGPADDNAHARHWLTADWATAQTATATIIKSQLSFLNMAVDTPQSALYYPC